MNNNDATGVVLHVNLFQKIISKTNLLTSWREFKLGKNKKSDVQLFDLNLAESILSLHYDLKNKSYRHGDYTSFYVHDPKLRHIHKPAVRDRILHHAVVRIIEPIFDKSFIFDSYSSRKNKGTHRAVLRLKQMAWQLSKNNTKTVWALKCDIKKFFDSVDHQILIKQLRLKIQNSEIIRLLREIIQSYPPTGCLRRAGIPLGNLTSQLFSNVYLNPLDQFVKRELKEKRYLRYADDFVVLGCDKEHLENLILRVKDFLTDNLSLELHPRKVILCKLSQGIDFLGYIVFPYYILLRTKTKRRMIRNIKQNIWLLKKGEITGFAFNQCLQSYLGLLKHCRGNKIRQEIFNIIKVYFKLVRHIRRCECRSRFHRLL